VNNQKTKNNQKKPKKKPMPIYNFPKTKKTQKTKKSQKKTKKKPKKPKK
jgi:hypothetical protein